MSSLTLQFTLNELLVPFFFGSSFICANRLMINIRVKYWQHEGSKTNLSRKMLEFKVPGSRPRVAPNSSALRYGLQPGDLESFGIQTGEAGPSNYRERAFSTRVLVTENAAGNEMAVACPPPINEPEADTDEEAAAAERAKAKAEETRNWLATASLDPTVSLDEIDLRADDVYRSTFQESFGF